MPQIKKVKNTWTQVPNTWLKDKNLSLKAKGLLAVMQSLPDNWEFSIRGLASILKEGVEAVQSTLQELENAGYLTRTPTRGEKGFFSKAEYVLHENPCTENPDTDKPVQYNTKIQNTKRERVCPADSADASSALSPFSFSVSHQERDLTRTANQENKRVYALCDTLLALMGQSGIKERRKLASAVKARLKAYSEVELKEVARWSATQTDEFLKVPSRLFSEGGFEQAKVMMAADKKKHISRDV